MSPKASFRRWLRAEGGVYLGGDKALQGMDEIGGRFLAAETVQARQALLGELRVQAEKAMATHRSVMPKIKAYVQVVELVAKRGKAWLVQEEKRLQRMVSSASLTAAKRETFQHRLEAVAGMLAGTREGTAPG